MASERSTWTTPPLEVLIAHRQQATGGDDRYAFAHPGAGRRLHPDAVSTRFMRLVRESGVRRLTFLPQQQRDAVNRVARAFDDES